MKKAAVPGGRGLRFFRAVDQRTLFITSSISAAGL
jgi:hypothetical protein